jgi:hypothetical protein
MEESKTSSPHHAAQHVNYNIWEHRTGTNTGYFRLWLTNLDNYIKGGNFKIAADIKSEIVCFSFLWRKEGLNLYFSV